MFKKAVFPGKYIQGSGAISELPALIDLLGKQGLLFASPSVTNKVLPKCGIDLGAQAIPSEVFHGECCEDELARLSAILRQKQVDVLIGMGGGKTIDTAKIAADRADIPVIVIPTIASTDAPCSGCAVLYSKDGIFQSVAAQFNQMAGQLQTSFDQLSMERDSLRRFITDASHELRTPITALKNFNDLLIQGADRDDQVRDEFLAESQLQIKRLEWITRNLLDLSRLDAGLVSLEISEQDGLSLVETVYSSFKPVADQGSIDLKIHPAANQPEQPIILKCDRARLEIALGNLVDNALKYTPQGGSVELGVEKSGELIRFWVEDNGSEIPSEDLPHLFECFYRGSNQKSDGSGLGLAIVYSIVQAHRGKVMAQNLLGGRVRFQIELPA